MSLHKLEICSFRNIDKQVFFPAPTFNFIYGKNGSGKSAFIEAIYLLGRGKSFRTSSIKTVIRSGQSELIVSADINQPSNQIIRVGIKLDGKTVEIRKNQQPSLKRSDLAYTLPLLLVHPKSSELLDGGAQVRREFMDWGAFHHETDFLSVWKKYKKALAQRNALLKLRSIQQLHIWDKELETYGTIVHHYRKKYVEQFTPILFNVISQFLPLSDFRLTLGSGWNEDCSLLNALRSDLDKDIRDGFTHSGPHRGDFYLYCDGKFAKDVVSRGQLKILLVCFKLAQIQLFFNQYERFGCVLIDDFAAELDLENRGKILKFLDNFKCQVFITATEMREFGDLSVYDHKMFHVEHGEFKVC